MQTVGNGAGREGEIKSHWRERAELPVNSLRRGWMGSGGVKVWSLIGAGIIIEDSGWRSM